MQIYCKFVRYILNVLVCIYLRDAAYLVRQICCSARRIARFELSDLAISRGEGALVVFRYWCVIAKRSNGTVLMP